VTASRTTTVWALRERLAASGWRAALWAGFFAAVLSGWAGLWVMAGALAGVPAGPLAQWLADLCGPGAATAPFTLLWAMWALMAAAMMLPSFAPALSSWMALPRAASGGPGGTLALAGGFVAAWALAAGLLALAQGLLAAAGLVAADARSLSPWLTAALLALAGGYQFSRLKAACLTRCRMPMTVFMAEWRPGLPGAARIGLLLGRDCLGCCWALMALAFAGGMASLAWMGVATLMMVVEKMPVLGRPLTRPLGWLLLGLAALAAIRAL
jgi:predicted metal-binding membrane protein